jgi:glycine cleavage system H protein
VDPEDRKYTREHEWVMIEGGVAVVGITDFAQDQLGDVVYVELPAVGDRVQMMQPFGVIESVKTASDLYAPVTGVVVEINESLVDEPQTVNDAPYASGWLIKVRPDDPVEIESLMSAQQYREQIGGA